MFITGPSETADIENPIMRYMTLMEPGDIIENFDGALKALDGVTKETSSAPTG